MTITLELTSLPQADALQAALETYIDMETDRAKHDAKDWTATDAARLGGAQQILKSLRGGK